MIEKFKNIIQDYFNDIDFIEKEHLYFYNKKEINKSVSKIVEEFVEPFDYKKNAERIAKRRGLTIEEVLEEWNNIAKESCKIGHKTHDFGEKYYINKNLKIKDGYQKAIVNFYNDLPPHIKIINAEIRMVHKKFLFCGTLDKLYYNTIKETFIIGDYKTNKDLFKNYKGKKLLYPFNNLLDNPYNRYTIQTNLYQILLEQIPGIKVEKRKIIWLKSNGFYLMYDTEDYTKKLINILEKNYESRRNITES